MATKTVKKKVTTKKSSRKTKTSKFLNLQPNFTKRNTVIGIVLVALVGSLTIFFASAASSPDTEPEAWAKSGSCVASVQDSAASSGSAIQFSCPDAPDQGDGMGDHDHGTANNNCTPGRNTLGPHGPCINNSLIPERVAGYGSVSMQNVTPVRTSPPAQYGGPNGEPGSFRTRCDFSHMNYHDAVLYPNQSGRAHLHTYFGNTGANHTSTSQSLKNSGNSTCSGGTVNRSAYWVPAMIETSTGRPIQPQDDRGTDPRYQSDLEIYYKVGYQGVQIQQIEEVPDGLQLIAGNPANASSPSPGHDGFGQAVEYYCEGPGAGDRVGSAGPKLLYIPTCSLGQVVVMEIDFPQCWDGRLTSPDGRSHLTYGKWGIGCPASHPRGIPAIQMFVRYQVTAANTDPAVRNSSTWRLSSDNYTNGPGGYSGHADYIFAWNIDPQTGQRPFQTIQQRCYRNQQDCGYSFGNGREPTHPRFIR